MYEHSVWFGRQTRGCWVNTVAGMAQVGLVARSDGIRMADENKWKNQRRRARPETEEPVWEEVAGQMVI